MGKGVILSCLRALIVTFVFGVTTAAVASTNADVPHSAREHSLEAIPQAENGIRIPEDRYLAIAKATLPPNASPNQVTSRVIAVKDFISSNGGDVIYKKYLAEYSAPADTRKWFKVQQTLPSTTHLGYYYLTHPLTSAEDTTWFDCRAAAERAKTSPTVRALCALDQWNAFILTGDRTYAAALVEAAKMLVRSNVNGQFQWTNQTIPAFGITTTPWTSALTQSVAISVLLRAFQYTGDQQYMKTAKSAFHWLMVPVQQGGLQSNDIGLWLEEYPNQDTNSVSGHVLNGNIWSMFGVWDYYRVTADPSAKELFDSDVMSIKNNMSWYDLGYWNVYSHLNRTDTVNGLYMEFIVQQMYALALITGDRYFETIGDKWNTDQKTDALFTHNMAQAFVHSFAADPH